MKPEEIPSELKAFHQFLLWDWRIRENKKGEKIWTKPPFRVVGTGLAKSTDSDGWGSFRDALAAARTRGMAGIGFALSADDPFCFGDIDDCVDPESGAIAGWAQPIVERFKHSYQEISPSGTGIKILVMGKLPGTQHQWKLGPDPLAFVQWFDHAKYTTLTGHRVPGTGERIVDAQAQLDALYRECFPPEAPRSQAIARSATATNNTDADDARLEKARSSRHGTEFVRLYDAGDISGYGNDHSAADQALCNMLAFWFGPDEARIDRMFRRSKLMREKWADREDYRKATIGEALAGKTEFYAQRSDLNGRAPAASQSIDRSTGELWPDRRPLPQATAVPTMNGLMLPDPFQRWIEETCDIARIPLEMMAAPAISSIGAVVGRMIGIKPWSFNDFVTVPNLWGLVVARPGWMKSYAVAGGLGMIGRLAAAEHERYEATKDTAAAELAALNAALTDITRRMRADAKAGGRDMAALKAEHRAATQAIREAAVKERRYLTHDATVEKLAEILVDNPRGMLVVRDEVYGLLRSFDKAGRENDRQFYLEGWSGTGSFTTDRIERGTIHIPSLTVTIIGGIQPGRLRSLIEEAASGGGGDDGLLQRFQLTVWPDQLRDWETPERWPDSAARERAFGIFDVLDRATPSALEAQRDGERAIPYLTFTPFAQRVADEWHSALEVRLRSTDLAAFPAFAAHVAKYRSLLPSLALLFHLIDMADGKAPVGPIGEAPLKLAVRWCEFLEAHARKLYDVEIDRGKAAARSLAVKIESGAVVDGQTVREIYRNQWTGLKTDETVLDALSVLRDLGWVRLESAMTAGRPSQVVRVHPELVAGGQS